LSNGFLLYSYFATNDFELLDRLYRVERFVDKRRHLSPDPHTKSKINALEMDQRRAVRFVSGNYNRQASVGAMLQSLGWENLQQRQRQAKAVMMYNTTNNLVAIDSSTCLYLQQSHVNS